MQTHAIGVGAVGECRILHAKKDGSVFKYIVKILCVGFAMDLSLEPTDKRFEELQALSGQFVTFKARMSAGYSGGVEFSLDDYAKGMELDKFLANDRKKPAA